MHAHPLFEIVKAGIDTEFGLENIFDNLDDALVKARAIVNSQSKPV